MRQVQHTYLYLNGQKATGSTESQAGHKRSVLHCRRREREETMSSQAQQVPVKLVKCAKELFQLRGVKRQAWRAAVSAVFWLVTRMTFW